MRRGAGNSGVTVAGHNMSYLSEKRSVQYDGPRCEVCGRMLYVEWIESHMCLGCTWWADKYLKTVTDDSQIRMC